MANPDSIDNGFATLAAGTGEAVINLNPLREYSIAHSGKNSTGADDEGLVVLATASGAAADYSAGAGRIPLPSGYVETIGPGIAKLYVKSASGAPVLLLIAGAYEPRSSRR